MIHEIRDNGATDLVVISAAAKMPSSCWGQYRRLALLEVEKGFIPPRIDERIGGILRVVAVRERLHSGGGDRTAFALALRDMLA